MKKTYLHGGHRNRLRDRYRKSPETVTDHELLELLLFYAIPQKDTNELAHRLLERFGSLDGVLHASEPELQSLDGLGETSSLLFPLMKEFFFRYRKEHTLQMRQIAVSYQAEAVADRYLELFTGSDAEKILLIGLDRNFCILADDTVAYGGFESATLDLDRVKSFVSFVRPCYAILAHNHPSGVALPSEADYASTEAVEDLLNLLGVPLQDHIIYDGTGDYVSFEQSGYFRNRRARYRVTRRGGDFSDSPSPRRSRSVTYLTESAKDVKKD